MPELDFTAEHITMLFDAGDDDTLTLYREDDEGNRLDITGWGYWFTVKEDKRDDDADAVIQKTVSNHTDPANGETQITLSKSDTEDLGGTYYHEIEEEQPNGTSQTLAKGPAVFETDGTTST